MAISSKESSVPCNPAKSDRLCSRRKPIRCPRVSQHHYTTDNTSVGFWSTASVIATLPTIPAGETNLNTTLAVAELLLSPKNCLYPTQYLYATNRNDPSSGGDTVAIFSMNPLALVTQVRTGLNGIRGAALGGPNGEYLVVGGQNGGGVVLYQRTNGGTTLTELARNSGISQPSSFVFLPTGQSESLCSS